MPGLDGFLRNSLSSEQSQTRVPIDFDAISISFLGGLFLETTVSSSIIDSVSTRTTSNSASNSVHSSSSRRKPVVLGVSRRESRVPATVGGEFLSVSLSIKRSDELLQNGEKNSEEEAIGNAVVEMGKKQKVGLRGRGAMNTTKHLWSGAVAAMVSRTFVAPLERLKLEYMVRGEQKNLFELIKTIAASQGLRGFWKGNLVNILRTAPFKAINFYAYDTYRKRLLKFSGNEETTNFERFIAGASAGITATVLCLPLDTVSDNMGNIYFPFSCVTTGTCTCRKQVDLKFSRSSNTTTRNKEEKEKDLQPY
ncbi:hypothetical protein ACSBR2_000908 [Camellia fascicularis]